MSALAVLLIIGSAVVGPIEAQPVLTDEQVANSVARFNEFVKREPLATPQEADARRRRYDREAGIRTETLPELCERAMREIGATRDVRGHWYMFETVGTAARQPNDYYPPAEVRCIPVPTGYKPR